ncbi:hypothetical protein DEU56DRAFT_918896 [Suillus clintonianus]|uniref:uncharacterized protein n=1 Tax=Suillus clintonianus TaxID=1904413 RepID=UPI001B87BFB0|nr:uncharacterized protein DEU56DRAFT_918896 [Suillus clintonianus]KAG2118375.1 hypothetical protein DEU56DRAFT_918896 [Suillus clintonianus]
MSPGTDNSVHIPPELIPSILQHISPTSSFPFLLPRQAFTNGSWQQYRHDLRTFLRFAFVCRTWCTFTREIMLHTLIVPWLDGSILQLCSILRQYGSYSRVVMIFTMDADGPMQLLDRNDFYAALGKCFRSMPQMPKVEIYGTMDKIFGHSLPAEVGRFEFTSLRSLKLVGSVGHNGKSILHALGRSAAFLETLEIMYFETWPSDQSLPTPLKKLRSLILQCTYLSVPGIIGLLRGPDEEANSGQTLRKLVIIPSHLQSLPPPDITPLLTFDSTGERLRFLMIHRLDPCRSLECCPALETFIYVSPTSSNIFPFLPRMLRRLAISATLLSPSDRFVAYISSENAQNLVHLAVALNHETYLAFTTMGQPFASVTEACKEAGVSLTWIVPGMLGLGLEGWDDATELFQTVKSLPRARLKMI